MYSQSKKQARAKYNKKYYAATQNGLNSNKAYSADEELLIIDQAISDTKLSKLLGRSVGAIQKKRNRLKNI